MNCGICFKKFEVLENKNKRKIKTSLMFSYLQSKVHCDILNNIFDYLGEGTFLFYNKMIFCFLDCPVHKAIIVFKFLLMSFFENNIIYIENFFNDYRLNSMNILEIFEIFNFQIVFNSKFKFEKTYINFNLNCFFEFFYEKYKKEKDNYELNLFDWNRCKVNYFFNNLKYLVLFNKVLKD